MAEIPHLAALYCAVYILNILLTVVLYRSDRVPAYARLSAFWIVSLVTTLIMGATFFGTLPRVFGLSTVILNSLLFVRILQLLAPIPLRLAESLGVLAAALAVSLGAWSLAAPFWVVSLPVAVAISWPMARAVQSLRPFYGDLTPAGRMLMVATGILVIHCLDYPFLATHPTLAPWGLTFGFGASMGVAVLSMAATVERVGEEKRAALANHNRQLEQFAVAASHDLKEPIRQVVAYSSLVAERATGLDSTTRRWLDYVHGGGKRAESLLGAMMDYLRVDVAAGTRARVNIDEIMDAVCEEYAVLLDEASARVVRTALPVVEGDALQLRQLFGNLLQNAVKYRGQHPPEIHVTSVADGGVYHFMVSDNGLGIPAEQHDRVFDLFKRGVGADKYPGTGLGLAICRRVVERHGGRIWLKSTPGQGTCFHFTLPRPKETES